MKTIWLDLEQTIITCWNDPLICNQVKVSRYVREQQPDFVNIFSFAVYNDDDRRQFDETMREWLSRAFDFKINHVATVEEMKRVSMGSRGVDFSIHEYISIWGKERAFIDWVRNVSRPGEFILVDDVVDDITLTRDRQNQIIRTVNVDRI